MKNFFPIGISLLFALHFSFAGENFSKAFEAYKAGSFDEALTDVESDLKQNPKSVSSLELKGKILLAKKLYPRARESLLSALDVNPNLSSAKFTLGDVAFAERSWNEALYYYTDFYKKTNDPRDVLLKIVYCQIASDQFPEANRLATAFSPTDYEHPGYYFARAAIEQASGNKTKAESLLQQAQTHYGIETYQRYLGNYLWIFKK